MYSATVMRITDDKGDRCVVIHADPVIHIAPELLDLAKNPDRQRITGDVEVFGELVAFGTPDEGLGRVCYRLTGQTTDGHGARWHVAEREELTADRAPLTTTEETRTDGN